MSRCLIRVLVCLVLGGVTTVAVAWSIATAQGNISSTANLFARLFNASGFRTVEWRLANSEVPKETYLLVELEGWGERASITRVETHRYATGEDWIELWEEMPGPHLVAAKLHGAGIEQRMILCGEFKWRQRSLVSFSGAARLAERRVGWPLTSHGYKLSGSIRGSTNRRLRVNRVWHVPNVLGKLFPSTDELVLPSKVLWPGFAINTIFYAAILWLLAFGPFAVRRFVRDKRGRCIKCGYDLRGTSGGGSAGGDVCPECGTRCQQREIDA